MTDQELIKRIQDALGTAETGDALVEVARNAHRAEMELASTYNFEGDDLVLSGPDETAFEMQRERAWLQHAEYNAEHADEMDRQDMEGRS